MARDNPKDKRFDDDKTYFVKGRTLNAIWAAIRAMKLVAGEGIELTQTPDGIEIHRKSS